MELRPISTEPGMPVWAFIRRNLTSYMKVMSVWIILSVLSGGILKLYLAHDILWWGALIWGALTCLAGMMIMFVASYLNLKKLEPGFRRLAAGEKNPEIPAVWCPVLTLATKAAIELVDKVSRLESSSEKMSRLEDPE